MAVSKTGITWTDATAGVLVGCSRKSEGCEQCYAEQLAGTRLRRLPLYSDLTRPTKGGPRWTGLVKWNPKAARQVRAWRRGRRVFINSMSDVFHESLSFERIAAVFAFMAWCRQHTFQVLTKRTDRALAFFQWVAAREYGHDGKPREAPFELLVRCAKQELPEDFADLTVEALLDRHPKSPCRWPLVNVELGASVENQKAANERVPQLLACRAWVNFLSLEPLLEEVDLDPMLCERCGGSDHHAMADDGTLWCSECDEVELSCGHWLGDDEHHISWVIVGGENTGLDVKRARAFDYAWARAVQRDCKNYGARFFFKQSGSRPNNDDKPLYSPKAMGGTDPSEWPADLRVQQLPDREWEKEYAWTPKPKTRPASARSTSRLVSAPSATAT